MTLSKIWVLAEASDGEVASTTLELLTKARDLADTVECVYAGDDADDIAETLGEYGCETVHQTGDLDGALVGVPTAAAMITLRWRFSLSSPMAKTSLISSSVGAGSGMIILAIRSAAGADMKQAAIR